MRKNNYLLFPNNTLEVLHFTMKETLSVMTSQYSNLALSRESDLNSFHNAVQVIHDELRQLDDALEERGIVPRQGKTSCQPEDVMPSSEFHF